MVRRGECRGLGTRLDTALGAKDDEVDVVLSMGAGELGTLAVLLNDAVDELVDMLSVLVE